MRPRPRPRDWLARALRVTADQLAPPTGRAAGRPAPGDLTPGRPGDPPEHWLRLVAAHAPGLLRDLPYATGQDRPLGPGFPADASHPDAGDRGAGNGGDGTDPGSPGAGGVGGRWTAGDPAGRLGPDRYAARRGDAGRGPGRGWWRLPGSPGGGAGSAASGGRGGAGWRGRRGAGDGSGAVGDAALGDGRGPGRYDRAGLSRLLAWFGFGVGTGRPGADGTGRSRDDGRWRDGDGRWRDDGQGGGSDGQFRGDRRWHGDGGPGDDGGWG
ncbi:hypothetical protein LQ51_30880, partial [Micromonospora sp. HK10]